MEAIILAGGFGRRLKTITGDLPKPMAPVRGRPFLEYVLQHLEGQGIRRVILAVGYRQEVIYSHFGNCFEGIQIEYSVETDPLGTGGAVKNAMAQIQDDTCIVLNGDTLFDVDLDGLKKVHDEKLSDLTIALKPLDNFDRYGCVEIDPAGRVRGFMEKRHYVHGFVNGGVYVMRRNLMNDLPLPDRFSLENDLLEAYGSTLKMYGVICDGYFIDIGVPDDFRRAEKELNVMVRRHG